MSPANSDLARALRADVAAGIASGTLELPVLPESAAAVLSACHGESCDARKLADLIQRDASLAGHVMRIANSPAYAPSVPIVSLQQAISRLGMRTLSDIALAVALRQKVFAVRGHDAELRAMWRHSALTAAWSRELARVRRRNVEGAFLAGLVHDLGRPVLLEVASNLAEVGVLHTPEFDAVYEELHAIVGAALLERWKLPAWAVAAVRWHHAPRAAGEHSDLAATIALADRMAHVCEGEALEVESHASLSQLGIYPDELAEVRGREKQVIEFAQAFT